MPTAIPSPGGSSSVAAADITDAGAKGIELIQSANIEAVYASLSLPHTQLVPLCSAVSTTSTTDIVLSQVQIQPIDYVVPPASISLEVIGSVVSGVTGTLTLYNLTDSSAAASLSWTETAATAKVASVSVPLVANTYELRWKKSGGGPTDYALIGSANLRLDW